MSFHVFSDGSPSGPSDTNGRKYCCSIAKNRIKFVNELQFLILDYSFIDSWNFKAICKFEGKSQTETVKGRNNTANLIQSTPISMANLTGKSEHQPAKNKVIETKNNQKPSANIMEIAGYIIRDLAKDIMPLHLFSGLFTRLQKVHLERCTCIRQLCRQFDRYSFDCSSRHPKKQPTARNLDASKKWKGSHAEDRGR